MKKFLRSVFAILCFILPTQIMAQLLTTQDFTGATPGSSAIGVPPINWPSNQTGTTAYNIANTTPLTLTNYNGGGGNYLTIVPGTGTRNSGQTFTPIGGSTNTYYYSFLLNIASVPTGSNYFMILSPVVTSTSYFSRLFAQPAGTGFYNLGVAKSSATGVYKATPTALAVNTTHLILIRYTYGSATTTDDKMYLWVDPPLNAEPDVSTAEVSDVTGNDGTLLTTTGIFDFRLNTVTPTFNLDGIRVAAGATSAAAYTALAIDAPVTTANYPKVANVTGTSTDAINNLDKTGTTYYVVQAAATAAPTVSQVLGGLDGTGAAAVKSGSFAVTAASTDATTSITGLTASTAYVIYMAAQNDDAIPKVQDVVTSVAVTTSGGASTAPIVTTNPVVTKTETTAVLPGTVNDNGASTTATFDYGSADATLATGKTTVAGSPGTVASGAGATAVSANIAGLTANTTYYYRVNGANTGGTSNGSILNFTTPPVAPVLTAATSVTSGGFTVNWSAVTGATSYQLDVSTANDFSAIVTGYNSLAVASGTSQAVTGLAGNTTYYYRVRAVGTGGAGANSAPGSQLTPAGTPVISTTGTLSVLNTASGTASSSTSFNVSGSNMSAGILVTPPAGFEVSLSSASGFAGSITVGAAGTIPSTPVYVRLAAADAVGTYSGNVVLTSTGAGTVNVATAASSVTTTPVIAWDFAPNAGNEVSVNATTINANLTTSAITRGSGLTPSALGGGFSSAGFSANADLADAIATGKFLQFTVNAASGYAVSLSSLDANFRRSATGPNTFQWQYSTDGTTFNNFGTAISYTLTTANGDPQTQIDLSGITAFQNVSSATTLTFRLYGYGGSSTGGTFALGKPTAPANDLSILGAVSAVAATPTIGTTGTLSALSTTYGTASASGTFNVSGSNMTAGILVTPPVGFEVSTDNTAFTGTVTVGGAGTIASTPVYIRLKANTAAASYSGNVALTSAGATTVNVATVSSTVSAAALTITANGAGKTYGQTLTGGANSTAFTSAGLKNSETIGSVTIAYSTGAAATDGVNTYTGSVTPSAATGGTFTAGNYNITYAAGAIIVSKANLTVTANNVTAKTYGTNLTGGSGKTAFTSTGLQNSETIGSVALSYGTGSATNSAVGSYTAQITPSFATGGTFASGNYNITYATGNITVTAAPLTIIANGVSKVVGITLTGGAGSTAFTSTGLANGETVGTVTITYGSGSASGDPAGTYPGSVVASAVTGGSFTASNYSVTYTSGDITVTNAPTATISTSGNLSALSSTYGTASASGTFNVSGTNMSAGILVTPPAGFEVSTDNTTFTNTVTVGAAGTIASTPLYVRLKAADNAGTYSGNIVLSSSGAANVNMATASSTVNTKALTITANDAVKTYGNTLTGAAGSAAFTSSGLVGTQTIGSVTISYGTGSAAVAGVGNYAGSVVASAATGGTFSTSNYSITYTAAKITVNAATLSITANSVTKPGGTTINGGSGSTAFTSAGLAGGETIGSVTITYGAGAASSDPANTYSGSVVASAATGGSFTASNYNITYIPGDITVTTPASITLTGSFTTFTNCPGTPSNAQSFTAAGSNLTADITVSAPAGYELSLTSGGTYTATLTLTQTGGNVGSTTIFARLTAASNSNPGGNISVQSTGAVTKTISASSSQNTQPSVTVGTVPAATTSSTTFTVPYSGAVGSPDKYSISTGATAMSGFTPVTNASLPGTPITVNIPASSANTYNFKLTVSNSTTGCVSASIPFNLTINASTPTINTSGTVAALSATYGSASASGTFNVSGTNMAAGILVTPPTGFEISTDNTTFAGTVTVGAAGTILSTPVYIRLIAGQAAANYAGNVVLSSASATNVNVAVSGTVNTKSLTITAKPVNKAYGQTLANGPAAASAISVSGLVGSESITGVTLNYGTGGAAATAVGSYLSTIVPSAATGANGFLAGNYNITYSKGDLFVTPVNLTITAADVPKTYGNTLSGSAGSTAFTTSALVNSETVGSVTISYGTGSAATATVGSYTGSVTASAATGGTFTPSNYNITYVQGNIIVSPATLTVTAAGISKSYGTALTGGAGSTAFTSAGLKNSETIGSVTITYGTGSSAASAAGTYTGSVTASAATGGTFNAGNYTISYTAADIVVNKASLTVTAGSPTKIYGAANPAIPVAYSGFAGTDNATNLTTAPVATTTATTTSPVGNYATTASGGVSSNYTFTYVPGSLSITPATLTVTATTTSKTYGSANPALTPSYTGFAGTDNAASLTTQATVSTTAVTGSPVGNYPTTASGATASNYTFNYVAGVLSVTPAILTVTAGNATKVYGSANPALTISYSGFIGADNAASLTTQPAAASTATATSPAGTYPTTASGGAAANYTFNYVAGTLTVTQATLTVTAVTVSRPYGTANPVLTVTYSGFAATDNAASLTTQPVVTTTATVTSPAGTYPTTASGGVSTNYTFNYVPGVLTVSKAALIITANSVNKNAGQVITGGAGSTTFTSSGLATGETIGSVTITYGAGSAANSAAGTYTGSVVASLATGGTFNAANYNITYVAGNIVVTQNTLTITVTNAGKVYGSANPVFNITYNGFVGTDNVSSLTTPAVATTIATAASAVGNYPITLSGASTPNYTIVYVPGTLTVTPVALTIAADNKSRAYAAANPALTVTYTGFVGADGPSSLISLPTLRTTAINTSLPGNYPITVNGAAAANYNIIYAAGTLTVTPLTNADLSGITVTAGALSPVFNSGTKMYTDTVAFAVDRLILTAIVADPTATIKVNGAAIGSGATSNQTLTAGSNTIITFVVTAQDGVTTSTYTVALYRATDVNTIAPSNIISPNGDGKNDTWFIKDILLYPNNTVTVYDRAGRAVYSRHGYTNDWAGTLNGAPLSEGTYYYTVDLGINTSIIKGFITILRNR